jgi:hypothetical protein
MANIEPQQTIHTQKYDTVDQCERVGRAIIDLEYQQLAKRNALNKNKKNYQISFKCV